MPAKTSFSFESYFPLPKKYWLLAIIGLALIVRLYKITTPLADWHSFRQADTASVTREYVKHGVDLLHPRYHDLSNIQSGTRVGGADNVEGWRMVEFPFINGLIATIIRTFPFFDLVIISRLFSILASLGTLLALFHFAKDYWGEKVGYVSALTFAILPYAIFYSRVILPEPFMLFFITFSILAFGKWVKQKGEGWLWSSTVSLSLALLLKPFVAFLAPVFGVLLVQKLVAEKIKLGNLLKLTAQLGVFGLIAFLPLLLWRNWIQQFPSGIPASDWLFNSNGIRFRPAWFRWLGWERLGKLFLGYVGLLFIPLAFWPNEKFWSMQYGVSSKKTSSTSLISKIHHTLQSILNTPYCILLSFWLSILAYFSVIATGNVQHDYYQFLIIPTVCLTVAIGVIQLQKTLNSLFSKYLTPLKLPNFSANRLSLEIVGVLFLIMMFGGWQQVKGYFNVNHWEYIEVGKRVDVLLPADAKVIAPAQGDTVFLFQTNRRGWPIGFEIDKKIANGAQYYVTTSYDDEARELEAKYETVEKTEKYLILDLRKTL